VTSSTVQAAALDLMNAITASMVIEHHRSASDPWTDNYWDLDNAHGMAIYYPPRSGGWDYNNYVFTDSWLFTIDTWWDEYLLAYFQMSGLPAEIPTYPGLPDMKDLQLAVYLPLALRGH